MSQSSLYHTAADGFAFAGDPGYTVPDPDRCSRCGELLTTARQVEYSLCDNHIMEYENELAAYWRDVPDCESCIYALGDGDPRDPIECWSCKGS